VIGILSSKLSGEEGIKVVMHESDLQEERVTSSPLASG